MSALDELIKAVEAGTAPWLHAEVDMVTPAVGCGNARAYTYKAYEGSLDAALALHEALLPAKFCPSVDAILRPSGAVEWRATIHEQGVFYPAEPLRFSVECGSDVMWNNAARALLLAILRAFHSQVQP